MHESKISSMCYSSWPSLTITGRGRGLCYPGRGSLSTGSNRETCWTGWYLTEAGNCNLYTYGNTTVVILYSPIHRWSSLHVGHYIVIFCTLNQSLSPTLNTGAGWRFPLVYSCCWFCMRKISACRCSVISFILAETCCAHCSSSNMGSSIVVKSKCHNGS